MPSQSKHMLSGRVSVIKGLVGPGRGGPAGLPGLAGHMTNQNKDHVPSGEKMSVCVCSGVLVCACGCVKE